MPYAVNPQKGTIINNADIGELPGGIAVKINERQKLIAKHIRGVVVFDDVQGSEEPKKEIAGKKLYGIDEKKVFK